MLSDSYDLQPEMIMHVKKYKGINLLLALLIVISACNGCGSNIDAENYSEDGYSDGTYCADVTYYNPNTGTENTYTLEVVVESNELVKIYWSNGGWLDEDHFTPEELDSDGYCSFSSDRGYEYTVQITGQDCGYTDEVSYQDDVEASLCPRCGDSKDSEYDDYCYWCQRKIEDEEDNTCSNCGAYEIGVYGGLCSSCEESEY